MKNKPQILIVCLNKKFMVTPDKLSRDKKHQDLKDSHLKNYIKKLKVKQLTTYKYVNIV